MLLVLGGHAHRKKMSVKPQMIALIDTPSTAFMTTFCLSTYLLRAMLLHGILIVRCMARVAWRMMNVYVARSPST
jgi:hypothetical protein